jgi:hypothetical protein
VLANTKTRLKRMEPVLQEQLINWGYAICDTAMRKWIDPALPRPDEISVSSGRNRVIAGNTRSSRRRADEPSESLFKN